MHPVRKALAALAVSGLAMVGGAAAVEIVAGLHTPMGMVWYHDELYVASKERVDAYSALVGARFTKHRTVVTLPVGVGESNNLALAPDGRMLLGISAPCDHCTPSSPYSGAVLSFEPDGTDLRVYASGIRAPIGLAFSPGTSDLFVTMNQRDDLGDQTPGDWLSLVTEGSKWGFPDCFGQGGSECDGVPAPAAELDKHAAVSGVAIVTGQLGASVGDAALAAEWSTGKVVRVALETHRVSTFLTGLKNPVALLLAPNGSLFVGDWATGTVYEVVR